MRLPIATIILVFLVVGTYFYLSDGTFYISDQKLSELSFNLSQNPLGIFTHMFIHVGVMHLAGNLVSLILFALLLEYSLDSKNTLAIFFLSGALSSILFSILNPNFFLVGASAAVSGMIGACIAVRPKLSIILFLLLPFLVYSVAFPIANGSAASFLSSLTQQKQQLQQNYSNLIQQNKTSEAIKVNETIAAVEQKQEQSLQGQKRDETVPSDFFVHLFGVLSGLAYVFKFKKKEFLKGSRELVESFNWVSFKISGKKPFR